MDIDLHTKLKYEIEKNLDFLDKIRKVVEVSLSRESGRIGGILSREKNY